MAETEHGGELVPELRVGDAERRSAMQALDTHLEAGRLSVDEYGDRSAAAVAAVHRSDLASLFADLPAPHPPLPRRPGDAPVAVPVPPAAVPAPADRARPVPHPGAGVAFGLMILLVVALPVVAGAVAAGGVPLGGFLLFPLLFLVLGGIGGHRGRRRGERD